MKIVHICERYYPYPGGIERVVKNTAEYLVRNGHEVTVYATDPLIAFPICEKTEGVNLRKYPSFAPDEAYFMPHISMLSDLSQESACTDILHANNIQVLTTLVAALAHKMHSGAKFVVSPFYHGRGHTKLAQMLWTPYKPLVKRILKNADAIIVNSKAQMGLLERDFSPQSRMYPVHDGVDVNKIKKAVPFEVDESLKTLLYVGRLEKYKNIHLAISAIKKLPRNYHFYIIGTGPYRTNLENLVRSFDITERVHFLGFQSDETVHRWMRTADAFLHLSSVESFGLTCIESLAAGTPVIANDDGLGLSETIELYPKYITKYKVGRDSCANLVRLIIDAARMKPVNVDVSSFSWDLIAKSVSNVYEQIL